jgi:hypothetical protein
MYLSYFIMFGVDLIFIKKQLHCFIYVVTVVYYSSMCVDYKTSFQFTTSSDLNFEMACRLFKYIFSLWSCSRKNVFGFDVCVEKVKFLDQTEACARHKVVICVY